jgi:two-component system, chemotaxis family, response regulator Rcp1
MPNSIMLVEDNFADVQLVKIALEEGGIPHRLITARNGDEALSFLLGPEGDPPPSLILLDLTLPGTDGREVLEVIRGARALDSIPVIVLTASASETDMRRTSELGANGYVVKPVMLEPFKEAIRSVASHWLKAS